MFSDQKESPVLEEDWEVMEAHEYDRMFRPMQSDLLEGRAILEMTIYQISTLWKRADLLKREKKFTQAKKCYEDSLSLTDGLFTCK